MNTYIKLFLIGLLSITASACEWTSDTDNLRSFSQGKGMVTYTGYEPLKDKPVNLHFYIPDGDMTNLSMIFIFPGTNRNAKEYLEGWLQYYSKEKAIVVAFEFPENHYSTSEYIEGNMFNNNQPIEEEKWSFSLIEPIFKYIKSETGNTTKKYHMFGHSAGAQFVHRFVTFKQNTNIDKTIVANAGWYTVPDVEIAYPYGLKNSGFDTNTTLQNLFKANMIVALGDQDTDPNDSSLRHTAEADAQGLTRFARGNYYYSESEQISKKGGYTFNWEKVTVKNVAHDFAGMMAETGKLLF